MPKNKEVSTSAMRDRDVTNIFCSLCIKEIELGNRPTTYFNKEGWQNISIKFKESTGRNYERQQLKNKWDQLKREWKLWKDLKRGSTGLGWDPIKRTVDASEEWWREKLEAIPAAKKFKVCGIDPDMEDKMDVMFKGVVATGQNAFNPSEQGFAGISIDVTPDVLIDSAEDHSINPKEVESTCQSKRRRKNKEGKNKDDRMQSSIDRLLEVFAAPQTVQTVVVDTSVDDVMTILDEIPEVLADQEFYLQCIKVLEDQTRRLFFKRLQPELRLQYLRFSIGK